tara:strand:- start:199 stop:873 length:675 start_codon:yes stop_codon:yes gene_type:complete
MDFSLKLKRFKYMLFLIPFFITEGVLGNIVYDKKEIIITEIELEKYKELELKYKNKNVNNLNAIKNIVLIKKIINQIKIDQPEYIKSIDKIIFSEYKEDISKIELSYLRYLKIRNEFIFQYFQNDLNLNDIKIIFDSYESFKVPISDNNCLTIIKVLDLKDNDEFILNFFENLKLSKRDFSLMINEKIFNICIKEETYQSFELRLINYIESKTEDSFKNFIYGN